MHWISVRFYEIGNNYQPKSWSLRRFIIPYFNKETGKGLEIMKRAVVKIVNHVHMYMKIYVLLYYILHMYSHMMYVYIDVKTIEPYNMSFTNSAFITTYYNFVFIIRIKSTFNVQVCSRMKKVIFRRSTKVNIYYFFL